MEYLQLIITGLSVVAAILAWVAKLRWSKEFADAKEATIAAKDAQIQVLEKQIEDLRDLTPMKLREYLRSSQELLEENIDNLKKQLEEAKTETKDKEGEISVLSLTGVQKDKELEQTIREKEEVNQRVANLENEIKELKTASEKVATALGTLEQLIIQHNFMGVSQLMELAFAQNRSIKGRKLQESESRSEEKVDE